MIDPDLKREINWYIDEQIEKHNTANQEQFQMLRDGQLKIEADLGDLESRLSAEIGSVESRLSAEIGSVESRLSAEIQAVRAASETAHKEIIERLARLEQRLG